MSDALGILGGDLPVWTGESDDRLICRQVIDETHDVKSFVLTAPTPHLFRYKPGQFLTFALPIGGEILYRCYTIASAPTRPYAVSITVKRVPGGPVSNWLHDYVRPGSVLQATGPLGDFTSALHPAPKYLFLSGGSGITPLMSMARSYADLAADADILFVHSARSPADLIFRRELDLIAARLPGFRSVAICENDAPDERWGGYRGRLSLEALKLIAPDFLSREIFTCGPAPYMAAVRGLLADAAFDQAHYHEESFVFADLAPEETASATATSFRIEFRKSGRVIECDAERFVLTAAKEAGMRLPSACTRGICGTCKSKLISGQVAMLHEGGIRQREIDQGQILICCSRPLGDLVIDR